MSKCCLYFFSVKEHGGISERSVSYWAYKKPLSLDIYPGETGRPSKVILHLFLICKNVHSTLPCSACSEHRVLNGKQINQTSSKLTGFPGSL